MRAQATAFAPASIGNLGVGFDVLGLAIAGAGDRVTATRTQTPGVSISAISGDAIAHDASELSIDPRANTASLAVAALWQSVGESDGVSLKLEKGTPLGSGMGSSAASAVAGVVAANALLSTPLPAEALLDFALTGEAFASGARHADNVAPSLLGGLILCPPALLPRVERIPMPGGLLSVLVHPHLRVNTADARRALSDSVLLTTAVQQMGWLAGFLQACHRADVDLLAACLQDAMIEPQRASLVAGFETVKKAALSAGALGCSLSGSGPSLFAIVGEAQAGAVAEAMQGAFAAGGVGSDSWISPLTAPGATVMED